MMVTWAMLLQVILCMFALDSTIVLQMKVLFSGQGQSTVVADPSTNALVGGAIGLTGPPNSGPPVDPAPPTIAVLAQDFRHPAPERWGYHFDEDKGYSK